MVYFETLERCYYGILCLSEENFKDFFFLLTSIGNLNLLSIKKTWAKTIVETIRKPLSNDIAKINLYLGIYTQGLY